MVERNRLKEEVLQGIVQRIVEAAQPEKIILFGSAARGEFGKDSDLDFLIIKRGVHRRHLTRQIRRNLRGVEYPIDLVVVTPEDITRYGQSLGLVIAPAIREGRVVYAA